MRCRIFLTAFVNLSLILFPYNIIGCAGGDDPYDFFTSFFDARLGNRTDLKPFYYTYNFLYDREEPTSQWESTSRDWINYTVSEASPKEAADLTGNYNLALLQQVYKAAEGTSVKLPDSVTRNRIVSHLIRNKDLEALGYLVFLRKIEPFVQVTDAWDAPPRDSIKMASWLKNGSSLFNAAKKDFFRQRYAYQLIRLSHYNHNYNTAIFWYDKEAATPISPSVHELSESLRAGALYRQGNRAQAAYYFCQAFGNNKLKKVSNYYGYHVYTRDVPMGMILGYCKTDKERANVLATISMGTPSFELRTLERISRLSPGDPVLDMLAVREINKLEEKYFSPTLAPGSPYFAYNYMYTEEKDTATTKDVIETAAWMEWMTRSKEVKNPALYATGAAYLHYMAKDYVSARKWLQTAKDKGLKAELADQWKLTELLVTVNEQQVIDKNFEEKILPSVQWLEKKALAESQQGLYGSDGSWVKFYRNFFNSIMAPRYTAQKEKHKSMLAIGTAENITMEAENGYYSYALKEVRNNLTGDETLNLQKLMSSKNAGPLEKYMITRSRYSLNDINDVIGTAYLRENKLDESLVWFTKVKPSYYKEDPYATYLGANPFADLILDTHAPTKQDTVKYSKPAFVKKLISLQKQFADQADPEKKARVAYELAKGYYHMTYWGNAWLLVSYEWSGSEGEPARSESKPWHKNYFGAQIAQQWYEKAFELSTDSELKAKALFMITKCAQKRDISSTAVFGKLKKEYANTKFYRDAVNTCSYLKDFVTGKTKIPGLQAGYLP